MKSKTPGCITIPGAFTALIAIVLIGGLTAARGGALFSPGRLNAQAKGNVLGGVRSHAEIAACSQCHAAPWHAGGMSQNCLACHTNITLAGKDFHNLMMEDGRMTPCQTCHTDHHGPEASLMKADLRNFPHDKTGFSLRTHRKLIDGSAFTCTDCHTGKLTSFSEKTCTDCHQKMDATWTPAHLKAFGENCLGCHDGQESYGKAFDHNRVTFRLQGKHTSVDCVSCHNGARLIADLRATPQDCATCHAKDEPHEGRFGKDCATCHTPDGWQPAKFDHKLAAFQLSGAHVKVECQQCHVNHTFRGTPQDCSSCHAKDDRHAGLLGQDCARCHTSDGWKPSTFDHSTAHFTLTGKHTQAKCDSCHTDLKFKDTPQDCFACHAKDDRHAGQLGQDCARCHTPDGWKPSTFDHNTATFPLTGKHLLVDCTGCHSDLTFKNTPQDCFACHAKDDHHNGQFGTDCGTCHNTSSWKDATFDHTRTAFKLSGAHLNLACTACHSDGKFKGTPSACVACHSEPAFHAGLLGTDCASCHSTRAWTPASFNGAHPFPINHGNPDSCRTCHPASLGSYTCYSCHKQGEVAAKHTEEGISNFDNCVQCHGGGGTGGGGGGD